MPSLTHLKERLLQLKPSLMAAYPIARLGIFGSYARNEQTNVSDVDILVEFNRPIGSAFIDLADALEDHLGVRVDLVSKGGIKDKYLVAIQKDLIYV
jgi:predicted nucleotidyltransferase